MTPRVVPFTAVVRQQKIGTRVLLFFCADVQVERRLRPELMGRPVAVAQYTSSAPIIAMSYEAKAKGIKRNMNGATARMLCPDVTICQVCFCHAVAKLAEVDTTRLLSCLQ